MEISGWLQGRIARINEAIGCYKATRALVDSDNGVENETGKSYNCLKDWRVRRRERARLELSVKSTSDCGNSNSKEER